MRHQCSSHWSSTVYSLFQFTVQLLDCYITGTHTPPKCPSGTFSNSTGLSNETECTICTAGYYCTTSGITDVQGPCTAGYYCPEGKAFLYCTECNLCLHLSHPLQKQCLTLKVSRTQTAEFVNRAGPGISGLYCSSSTLWIGSTI